jgi:hypothetical protein
MINTVPSHVALSDVVQLITAKPMDVQLDIGPVGLTLNATLRVCNFTGVLYFILLTANLQLLFNSSSPVTVTMRWDDQSGAVCSSCSTTSYETTPVLDTVIPLPAGKVMSKFIFGPSIPSAATKLWFEVRDASGSIIETVDNGGQGLLIDQPVVIFSRYYSHILHDGTFATFYRRVVVAVSPLSQEQ